MGLDVHGREGVANVDDGRAARAPDRHHRAGARKRIRRQIDALHNDIRMGTAPARCVHGRGCKQEGVQALLVHSIECARTGDQRVIRLAMTAWGAGAAAACAGAIPLRRREPFSE